MSGVGNNVGGSTIFSDNTVQGGVNDVVVNNLVVEGDLQVLGSFDIAINEIDNDLLIKGNLQVGDPALGAPVKTLNVTGTTQIGGGLAVTGLAQLNDDATIGDDLGIGGDVNIGVVSDTPSAKRVKLSHSAGNVEYGMDVGGNALITTQRLIIPTREPYSNVVYVATTGDNLDGTGSMTNPYLSISQALITNMPLYADLCVHVAAGTYPEDLSIPNFACSVTIIGAAFPTSDYEGPATDQYSTILAGNFNFTAPNTADSQVSLKYLRFNFGTSKFMNLNAPNVRGPVYIDSCLFTRQNADEAQVLASITFPVFIRNSTLSRIGTADSTTTIVNFSNNTVGLENCLLEGRVITNGLIQIAATATIDNCTFRNVATSTTDPAPCILTTGAITGRQFRCSNSQFFLQRGAIFQNTRTATSPIIFNNCIYTLAATISSGATFMFMNTSGTSCGIGLLNVAQFWTFGGTSVKRARSYDPVNFTLLSSINQAQSIYMADFNLEEVNSVNGVNNTNLHIEAVGTGHVALRTAGTARVVVNEAGLTTFNTTLPVCSVVPTTGNQLVNKTYVDGAITAAGYIPQIVATGGDSVVDYFLGGIKYRCHRFTTTGAYTLTLTSVTEGAVVDIVLIGGGGSGGDSNLTGQTGCGGGGGAGGLLVMKQVVITTAVTSITGAVGPGGTTAGGAQSNVVLYGQTYVAIGGGFGGNWNQNGALAGLGYINTKFSPYNEQITGSAGGAGGSNMTGGTGGIVRAFPQFEIGDELFGGGLNGGNGSSFSGGGGGGVFGAGVTAPNSDAGGNGGAGYTLQFDNVTRLVCGGGGGGGTATRGTASFGGGQGGLNTTGANGVANTGAGGGGGSNSGLNDLQVGGQGGSGIVMIRYPIG
jgi:hypothetical protein